MKVKKSQTQIKPTSHKSWKYDLAIKAIVLNLYSIYSTDTLIGIEHTDDSPQPTVCTNSFREQKRTQNDHNVSTTKILVIVKDKWAKTTVKDCFDGN